MTAICRLTLDAGALYVIQAAVLHTGNTARTAEVTTEGNRMSKCKDCKYAQGGRQANGALSIILKYTDINALYVRRFTGQDTISAPVVVQR